MHSFSFYVKAKLLSDKNQNIANYILSSFHYLHEEEYDNDRQILGIKLSATKEWQNKDKILLKDHKVSKPTLLEIQTHDNYAP